MPRSGRPDTRLAYFDTTDLDGRPLPLGFSHRGFAPGGDENTMAAFERAVQLGYGYLEIDVRASADGVVMVFHDRTLERVTRGTGPVGAHSAAELGELSVSEQGGIPTLEQVLVRWPSLRLNVDVKSDDCVRPFAALINRRRAHDRVLVASFSDRRRRKALALLERPTASSAGMVVNGLLVLAAPLGLVRVVAALARIQAVQVPETYRGIRVVSPRFVGACHAAGLQVHVWTINERADMDRLLDLGVDGVVSDAADVLAACLADRKAWPQDPRLLDNTRPV